MRILKFVSSIVGPIVILMCFVVFLSSIAMIDSAAEIKRRVDNEPRRLKERRESADIVKPDENTTVYVGGSNWCGKSVDEIRYNLFAKKDGVYLIETYVNPHRAHDEKLGSFSYNMIKGEAKNIRLSPRIYRIEIYWSDGVSITNESVLIQRNFGCN